MINFKKSVVLPAAAVMALVGFVGSDVVASAQTAAGMALKTHMTKRYNTTLHRPLTVRRAVVPVAAAVVAAPVAVAAGVVNPVTGVASTVVGLPFQAIGGIFPAGGARTGGVTVVRYAGTTAETAKIDEGWAAAVPVDASGPIFVVENGDPTINPLSLIGAPLSVVGTLAQSPFKIIGATGL